ncbi:MAG: anti-sigma factor family protein [Desulfohalobiaceae bacterium]
MSNSGVRHLTDSQLCSAAVDHDDLDPVQQRHLQECPRCRAGLSVLEQSLRALGSASRQAAPSMPRGVDLSPAVRRSAPWTWPLAGGLTAAAAAAVIVLTLWAGGGPEVSPIDQEAFITQQGLADRNLQQEVTRLVENPLPSVAFELSGEERVFVTDEDFLEFVAPPIPDEIGASKQEWSVC